MVGSSYMELSSKQVLKYSIISKVRCIGITIEKTRVIISVIGVVAQDSQRTQVIQVTRRVSVPRSHEPFAADVLVLERCMQLGSAKERVYHIIPIRSYLCSERCNLQRNNESNKCCFFFFFFRRLQTKTKLAVDFNFVPYQGTRRRG